MGKQTSEIQVVTFRTGMETYAMEISRIREIIMPRDITRVPGMGDAVKGIINLRGEIIPVMELVKILNAKRETSEKMMDKPRVVILDQSQGGYGILVDEVMQVIKVQSEDIKTHAGCEQIVLGDRMVKGIIHANGKMIICLDPAELAMECLHLAEDSNEMDHETAPV